MDGLAPGIGGSITPQPGYIPPVNPDAAETILATDDMEKMMHYDAAHQKGADGPHFGMPNPPPWLQEYMEPERSDPETGMPIGPNYGVLMVDRAGHQKYSQERERLKLLKEQMKP